MNVLLANSCVSIGEGEATPNVEGRLKWPLPRQPRLEAPPIMADQPASMCDIHIWTYALMYGCMYEYVYVCIWEPSFVHMWSLFIYTYMHTCIRVWILQAPGYSFKHKSYTLAPHIRRIIWGVLHSSRI